MAWYGYGSYGGFAPYVPAAVKRANARRTAAKLRKGGQALRPVEIEGRTIASTFWGKAWCDHIETCGDYANRLPRGRTYARNGSVIDLQIETGKVRALVSGSELYQVKVDVRPLAAPRWTQLVSACAGKIDSVVELLTGELSDGVMRELCDPHAGLFPASSQLSLACSCPDGARLCKHLAAVLYGVGARLDREPELFFVLRGVDKLDLVGAATGGALGVKSSARGGLQRGELADIFGIELDGAARSSTARGMNAGAAKQVRKPGAKSQARSAPAAKKKGRANTRAPDSGKASDRLPRALPRVRRGGKGT